jgi:Ni/Fe-hydrogenase 1 B-type cytochrome subunit
MSTVAHPSELRPRDTRLERIYVWELPVRITHWLIFFSVIILSATGYYIGHPFIGVRGAARDHFVMGTARAVHLYAAIVFTLAVLVRVYWLFAGNIYARLMEFIPLTRARYRSLYRAALFYAFIRRDPDEYPGHSALAGGSYAAIFFVYFTVILTGLTLYATEAPVGSPLRAFTVLAPLFGGLPMARLIHHVGMWLILIFVVVHVYFVLLASITERTGVFDSMFSGYKFFPRKSVRR